MIAPHSSQSQLATNRLPILDRINLHNPYKGSTPYKSNYSKRVVYLSRLSEAQKMEIYYQIYEQLLQDERVSLAKMSRNLGLARNTVSSHYHTMIENEILLPPALRLKMFKDLREYVYYLRFDKPMQVNQELEHNPKVVYHCVTSGAFDMVVTTYSPVDFESHPKFKGCLLSGPRSDIYFPAPISRDSYEVAFQKIQKTLQEEDLKRSSIPMEFPKREIIWSDLEWELFYDLKHDTRRTFTEIVKTHDISKWLFYRAYERIRQNCIRIVSFFPKKRLNYSDFYFIFKTDYEQALADLFMQLPCNSMIWRVDDRMVAWINIVRTFSFKRFFGLLHWMDDHGIIEDLKYALAFFTPVQSRKGSRL